MATGLLGQSALAAATNTTLYTVPSSTFTVCSISLCNRGTTTATVRVALAASTSPTNAEYIEYDAQIGANGVLERTGIMINAGKNIVVYANTANVSASAFGIETTTS
jgi:hypothetical protein